EAFLFYKPARKNGNFLFLRQCERMAQLPLLFGGYFILRIEKNIADTVWYELNVRVLEPLRFFEDQTIVSYNCLRASKANLAKECVGHFLYKPDEKISVRHLPDVQGCH